MIKEFYKIVMLLYFIKKSIIIQISYPQLKIF